MDISTLYNTAKNFADKVKEKKPDILSDPDAALCLIVADSQDIFSGVTSIKIDEGTPEVYNAEDIAVNALIAAGGMRAKQMILISIDDHSFFQPNEEALARLMRASVSNGACEVVTSLEETASAASLVTSIATPDFLSGYDDDTPAPDNANGAKVGAPAEFANGFDVDENNPFNAGGNNQMPSAQGGDINSLYDQPADAQQVGASGFPNPYMQQQPGYPQQGGYPQYPQQGGFPQQGGYPQYPQQGGYPQYPQQGGYPQYPQQGGYPQQGCYPQHGYPQDSNFPKPNPYMGGGHTSVYQQNMNPQNAAPYGGGFGGASVHVGSGVMPARSMYQQGGSSMIETGASNGAAYKKRLNNFLGEDESASNESGEGEAMSKDEMLKLAKDKKKVAKANFNFKKKM